MIETEYLELLKEKSTYYKQCLKYDPMSIVYNTTVLKTLLDEKDIVVPPYLFEDVLKPDQLHELYNLLLENTTTYEPFSEYLINLLHQKRIIKDSEVYKPAKIASTYWGKLINGKILTPSLNKLLRISAILRLNLSETTNLLMSAGYHLNDLNNPKGIIISYCFNSMIYNLDDIELILKSHDQPGLFDHSEIID